MPDPPRNFQAFAASLEKSGFKVTPHSAPWRPDYLGAVQSGEAQLFLLGWTGDFGDPGNFLNVHFGVADRPVRVQQPDAVQRCSKAADAETNLAKRTALYQQASIAVMKFLPIVPYVHSTAGAGVQEERQRLHRRAPWARAVLARRALGK